MRPRSSVPITSSASAAVTSSGVADGGTRPYMSPSGSTSTVGANRQPPRWLACQTRPGRRASSATVTGRPRSAQHGSCLPWVQTR